MMNQYWETKKQYMDCLLFYRLGDFYELFFDDAKVAAKTLDLVLTHRGKYLGEEVPMCGIPFHAYENYLVRLVRAGFKVAICEQMELPEEAKKRGSTAVVKRDVIRVVTAGTLTEDALLNARRHNYLACIAPMAASCGVAWVDMSTGDFGVQESSVAHLPSVLARLEASEVLIPEGFDKKYMDVWDSSFGQKTECPEADFSALSQQEAIKNYPAFSKGEQLAIGVLLNYLNETQRGSMPQLSEPQHFQENRFMQIDGPTRRSLELTTALSDDKGATSLLSVLDRTQTGAGARLLASYLAAPLMLADEINARLDKITYFVKNPIVCDTIRQLLKETSDIEREISRLSVGRGGPRDMLELAKTLNKIPSIRTQIEGALPLALQETLVRLGEHSALADHILRYISENAPLLARDGGFIKRGASAELDEIINIKDLSKKIIADLQKKYSAQTGINTLKIAFNNLVGYYVEVPSKAAEPLLMDKGSGFIHRQTMANCVRFTTTELSDLATKILHADEQALTMELQLFEEVRQEILSHANTILTAALALAEIDVASALADLATENNWTRPVLNEGTDLRIKEGRHPVVEAALKKAGQTFIPNDCDMNPTDYVWVLTGPNMAGKSTYLRQNALIVILAQMGSYVPAEEAEIGLVDKVFSRVGASDDLARGRSTFMVEMVEVATILNYATPKSLVILDEVGRGTATYDGLSLAWAVVEYLHNNVKARALFATHYHELTGLASRLNNLSLHTMKIKEWQGDIVFLHEVGLGAVERSYGIHVAKMAGLPAAVVDRAEAVLAELEEKKKNQKPLFDDLPLFSVATASTYNRVQDSVVEKKLKELDIDALSPREALTALYDLKKEIKDK
ncbi:MAG: DNA mismatch repair protein MutS [Alphaproteobacteria bacterium]|nr:DNA mismatch repair protein MutS [Alphaproteobacteria bacterium]